MNELIKDSDSFSSIKPEILENFLYANDWYKVKRVNNELIIFAKYGSTNKKQLVWMPLVSDASDYSSMVERLISTVADVGKKSIRQVLDDLQTGSIGDVIRVRSYDPLNLDEHTIPLKEGIGLFQRVRQMATASALSVTSKKAIQPRTPPEDVKKYVSSLKLSPTEKGSFIVRLISPIDVFPHLDGEIQDFSERIPFSRRAVVELVNNLNVLNDVASYIERKGAFEIEPFQEAVPKGVSVNLCEAISPIISEKENASAYNRPIDVSVTWSYLIKDKTLPMVSEVSFDHNLLPIIQKAAQELRAKNPEIITLKGRVYILERNARSGPGFIRLSCKLDNGNRSVKMKLSLDDYGIAIDAHKQGLSVSVTGELIVERNSYRLENPTDFHLLADEYRQSYYLGSNDGIS